MTPPHGPIGRTASGRVSAAGPAAEQPEPGSIADRGHARRRAGRGVGAVAAVLALLATAGCGASGVVPVTTVPPASDYPVIEAVQAAVGGDWSKTLLLPHSACTPPGGEPDMGMRMEGRSSSETTRSAGDVEAGGDLVREAMEAQGFAVDPFEAGRDETVVTGTDPEGSSIVVTLTASPSTIVYGTPCNP